VKVGDHNRYESEPSEEAIGVEQIIMHEAYGRGRHPYNNDIALLRLAAPVEYASEVSPVCLPATDVMPRSLCVVTGWGETEGRRRNDTLH
jgi:hypothetical protein